MKYEVELMSSMIKEIKSEHLGKVKLKDFVKLLEHLRFIAPVNQFIPSILDSHEGYNVLGHYGEQKFNSLLITFSSGSLHRSVFCYLAADTVYQTIYHQTGPNQNMMRVGSINFSFLKA